MHLFTQGLSYLGFTIRCYILNWEKAIFFHNFSVYDIKCPFKHTSLYLSNWNVFLWNFLKNKTSLHDLEPLRADQNISALRCTANHHTFPCTQNSSATLSAPGVVAAEVGGGHTQLHPQSESWLSISPSEMPQCRFCNGCPPTGAPSFSEK